MDTDGFLEHIEQVISTSRQEISWEMWMATVKWIYIDRKILKHKVIWILVNNKVLALLYSMWYLGQTCMENCTLFIWNLGCSRSIW